MMKVLSAPCSRAFHLCISGWLRARVFVIVPGRRIRCNRNYTIMRPLSFRSDELRSLLLHSKIATLDELKQALGTSVDITVFRKLKPLDYLTSYSHRGRYYTLHEIARFDDTGLWLGRRTSGLGRQQRLQCLGLETESRLSC